MDSLSCHLKMKMKEHVEIKDFNVLIYGKSFFDVPMKSKKGTYQAYIEIGRNSYYITGSLLDYE